MVEPCPECNCGNTKVEWLNENQTGRSGLSTRILHCPNCQSNTTKLIPRN